MHVAAEAWGLWAQCFGFWVLEFRDFGEELRFRFEGHQSGVIEFWSLGISGAKPL